MRPNNRSTILKAAVNLALSKPYCDVYREDVARASNVAESAVNYHFETMAQLRDAIVAYAVEHEVTAIVLQAIAANHPLVKIIPESLKRKLRASI